MANQKRASMREGPLAALFRRTEELQEEGRLDEHGNPIAPPPARDLVAEASEPSPAAVARAAEEGPDTSDDREVRRQEREERRLAAERSPQEPATAAGREAAERSYPHPGFEAEPVEEEAPVPAPSAHERLRNAFSSELPDDLLAPVRDPEPEPQREDPRMPKGEPNPWGKARGIGHPTIRVVGVGGAGVNAVNRMVEAEVAGIEFLAINTDVQSLQASTADITLQIGTGITRGLGAGANPDLGRASAMEDHDKIKALLKGSDMVFIAAGAGGGTGTGAAPVVARIAKELGALTVGIITRPFGFEGSRRASAAEGGVSALGDEVDTLIVVPNNRLLSVLDKQVSMVDAFRVADDVLRQGVQGISDLVTLPGLINLDFADVRTIMSDAGPALLGIGMGAGESRAVDASRRAVESPLLETSMEGARKILLSITAGDDLSLFEVNEAAKAVAEAAHPDANIIFGAMVDEKLEDQVWVTVVATGYSDHPRRSAVSERASTRYEEPRGEVRVERVDRDRGERRNAAAPAPSRPRRSADDLDVPEFIPRGR